MLPSKLHGNNLPRPKPMGGGAGADESVSAAESIIIGGIAGSVAEICVQPALVVRTRMMVQGVDRRAAAFSSFFDCVRTMCRTEGFGALKGGTINAFFTPIARGLFMAGTEVTKSAIGEDTALKNFAGA